jgi:hypothetical protein
MVTLTINSQSQLYRVSKIPGSVLNRIKARLTVPRGFTARLVGILRGPPSSISSRTGFPDVYGGGGGRK